MSCEIDFDHLPQTKSNAPNLIFIHGAGGDKTQWEKQRGFFQKYGWGVITLSLPSHGQSYHLKSVTLDNYVKTVYDFVIDRKIEDVSLVGHSMGGAIALECVLQNPDLIVNKLILIGTGAKLKVNPVFFEAIETDFNQFLELLGKVAFHRNTSFKIKNENERILRGNGATIFYQDFKICNLFDTRSKLQNITNQTLILVGQDDQMTPVKYSTFLHENIKNSQLAVIPEAGHYVFQEKPLAVNKQIYKFISG